MRKTQLIILAAGAIMNQTFLSANEPVVDKGKYNIYPVTANVKTNGLPQKLPSGAKEFNIDAPQKSALVLDVADFGMSETSPDNTEAFQKTIAEAKKRKAGEVKIRKGIYRFSKTLKLYDLSDIEINGGGSTFVYHIIGKQGGELMHIVNGRRIILRNLALDWAWDKEPLAAIAQVKARDTKAGSIDFHVPEFEKRPDLQKSLRIMAVDKINPKTFNLDVPGESSYYSEVAVRKKFHREWLPGAVFRFCDPQCAKMFAPGTWVRLRIAEELRCGILFTGNKHMLVSDVTVHAAPGGALIINGEQQYWCFERVKVQPVKGRCMSSLSDALHFTSSKGFFKMLDCDFSFSGDDCFNVHDGPKSSAKIDDSILQIRCHISWLKAGDSITLRNDDLTDTGYEGKIVSFEKENAKSPFCKVRLDKPLPKNGTPRLIARNKRYSSDNIIIRNSRMHENRARGFLICSNDVTIENCHVFGNSGAGFEATSGYFQLWNEGYGVDNVVIRNNVFENVSSTKKTQPYLENYCVDNYIGVLHDKTYKGADVKGRILKNILFKNNRYINPRGLLLHASSCQNIFFIGNKIEFTGKPEKNDYAYAGSFFMRNMEGAYIYDNQFIGLESRSPFLAFRKDCKDINIGRNTIK